MKETMLDWVDRANRHWMVTIILFAAAGLLLHFAVESWTKALAIVIGATMLDVAVDLAFTKLEEEAGEID